MMVDTTANNKALVRSIVTMFLSLALITGVAIRQALADDQTAQQEETVKLPHTAKDHYALAELYEKKVAEYKSDIEMHKKMLEEYKKTVATNPKDIGENAYLKKMRLHCERYLKAAESMEAEANDFAKFHTLRAKELEGK